MNMVLKSEFAGWCNLFIYFFKLSLEIGKRVMRENWIGRN